MEKTAASKTNKREKNLQNNIGFFFIVVLIFTLIGFYPSYFNNFANVTKFKNVSWVYHFHAFFATLWIVMLITQAFLIRRKKYALHRKIGKASYFVIPFVLFSFFLVAKAMYLRNINVDHISETDALAGLSGTGLPDIVYLGILYSLGIYYKNRPAWHLRFFTCTGIMILGPGLGRFVFRTFIPEVAGATMGILFLLVPLIWLVVDIIKKKSPIPLLVFIAISLTAAQMGAWGHTGWWQTFAKWFVAAFF